MTGRKKLPDAEKKKRVTVFLSPAEVKFCLRYGTMAEGVKTAIALVMHDEIEMRIMGVRPVKVVVADDFVDAVTQETDLAFAKTESLVDEIVKWTGEPNPAGDK